MLHFLIICLIAGSVGAVLQGMIGIGTGIIITPLLTLLLPHYGIAPDLAMHIALTTSMAVIAVNSFSALLSHHRRGNISWPLFQKMVWFSMTGAVIGALIASAISGRYLQLFFGLFMVVLACYMMRKKPQPDHSDNVPALPLHRLAGGGFSIGLVGSLIGAGGGVLMVPFLHAHQVKLRYAVGTATLLGLPVTLVGSLTYILTGLASAPTSSVTIGYLHWPAFLAISAVGVLCAPLGAKLTTKLPTAVLQKIFAACMMIVGLKMLF